MTTLETASLRRVIDRRFLILFGLVTAIPLTLVLVAISPKGPAAALRHLPPMRLHAPELQETVARKLVELVAMVRELDLKKPPSIAESIDWARALLLLGAQDIDAATFNETMSVIVKHRTDIELVAERVGLALS